jgi:hypothetical protein
MLKGWHFLEYLGRGRLRRDKQCNRLGNCRVKRSMGAIPMPYAIVFSSSQFILFLRPITYKNLDIFRLVVHSYILQKL